MFTPCTRSERQNDVLKTFPYLHTPLQLQLTNKASHLTVGQGLSFFLKTDTLFEITTAYPFVYICLPFHILGSWVNISQFQSEALLHILGVTLSAVLTLDLTYTECLSIDECKKSGRNSGNESNTFAVTADIIVLVDVSLLVKQCVATFGYGFPQPFFRSHYKNSQFTLPFLFHRWCHVF